VLRGPSTPFGDTSGLLVDTDALLQQSSALLRDTCRLLCYTSDLLCDTCHLLFIVQGGYLGTVLSQRYRESVTEHRCHGLCG